MKPLTDSYSDGLTSNSLKYQDNFSNSDELDTAIKNAPNDFLKLHLQEEKKKRDDFLKKKLDIWSREAKNNSQDVGEYIAIKSAQFDAAQKTFSETTGKSKSDFILGIANGKDGYLDPTIEVQPQEQQSGSPIVDGFKKFLNATGEWLSGAASLGATTSEETRQAREQALKAIDESQTKIIDATSKTQMQWANTQDPVERQKLEERINNFKNLALSNEDLRQQTQEKSAVEKYSLGGIAIHPKEAFNSAKDTMLSNINEFRDVIGKKYTGDIYAKSVEDRVAELQNIQSQLAIEKDPRKILALKKAQEIAQNNLSDANEQLQPSLDALNRTVAQDFGLGFGVALDATSFAELPAFLGKAGLQVGAKFLGKKVIEDGAKKVFGEKAGSFLVKQLSGKSSDISTKIVEKKLSERISELAKTSQSVQDFRIGVIKETAKSTSKLFAGKATPEAIGYGVGYNITGAINEGVTDPKELSKIAIQGAMYGWLFDRSIAGTMGGIKKLGDVNKLRREVNITKKSFNEVPVDERLPNWKDLMNSRIKEQKSEGSIFGAYKEGKQSINNRIDETRAQAESIARERIAKDNAIYAGKKPVETGVQSTIDESIRRLNTEKSPLSTAKRQAETKLLPASTNKGLVKTSEKIKVPTYNEAFNYLGVDDFNIEKARKNYISQMKENIAKAHSGDIEALAKAKELNAHWEVLKTEYKKINNKRKKQDIQIAKELEEKKIQQNIKDIENKINTTKDTRTLKRIQQTEEGFSMSEKINERKDTIKFKRVNIEKKVSELTDKEIASEIEELSPIQKKKVNQKTKKVVTEIVKDDEGKPIKDENGNIVREIVYETKDKTLSKKFKDRFQELTKEKSDRELQKVKKQALEESSSQSSDTNKTEKLAIEQGKTTTNGSKPKELLPSISTLKKEVKTTVKKTKTKELSREEKKNKIIESIRNRAREIRESKQLKETPLDIEDSIPDDVMSEIDKEFNANPNTEYSLRIGDTLVNDLQDWNLFKSAKNTGEKPYSFSQLAVDIEDILSTAYEKVTGKKMKFSYNDLSIKKVDGKEVLGEAKHENRLARTKSREDFATKVHEWTHLITDKETGINLDKVLSPETKTRIIAWNLSRTGINDLREAVANAIAYMVKSPLKAEVELPAFVNEIMNNSDKAVSNAIEKSAQSVMKLENLDPIEAIRGAHEKAIEKSENKTFGEKLKDLFVGIFANAKNILPISSIKNVSDRELRLIKNYLGHSSTAYFSAFVGKDANSIIFRKIRQKYKDYKSYFNIIDEVSKMKGFEGKKMEKIEDEMDIFNEALHSQERTTTIFHNEKVKESVVGQMKILDIESAKLRNSVSSLTTKLNSLNKKIERLIKKKDSVKTKGSLGTYFKNNIEKDIVETNKTHTEVSYELKQKKSALDKVNQSKELLKDKKGIAEQTIESMEKANPNIRKAVEMRSKWFKQTTDFIQEEFADVLPNATRNLLKQRIYESYFPVIRYDREKIGAFRKATGGSGSHYGAGEAMLAKIDKILSDASTMRAKATTMDALDNAVRRGDREVYWEDMTSQYSEDAFKKAEEFHGQTVGMTDDEYAVFRKEHPDYPLKMIRDAKEVSNSNPFLQEGHFYVVHNGKKMVVKFNKGIGEAFKTYSRPYMNIYFAGWSEASQAIDRAINVSQNKVATKVGAYALRAAHYLTITPLKTMRFLILVDPQFQVNNLIRDFAESAKRTDMTLKEFLKIWAENVGTRMLNIADEYQSKITGKRGVFLSDNYLKLISEVDSLFDAYNVNDSAYASSLGIPNQRRKFFDLNKKGINLEKIKYGFDKGISFTEGTSRKAQILHRLKQLEKEGKDLANLPMDVTADIIQSAFDISIDWSEHGRASQFVSIAPFGRATLTGVSSDFEFLMRHPKQYLTRTAMTLLPTAMTIYWLNHRSQQISDIHNTFSNQIKKTYWSIIVGFDKDKTPIIYKIAKPKSLGGTMINNIEYMVDRLMEVDPEKGYYISSAMFDSLKEGAKNTALESMGLDLTSYINNPVIQSYFESKPGAKKWFWGTDILSPHYSQEAPIDQQNEFTSKPAKSIGEATNTSPMILDNWFKNIAGTLGSSFLEGTSEAKGGTAISGIKNVFSRRAITLQEQSGYRDKNVQNFYDEYDNLNKAYKARERQPIEKQYELEEYQSEYSAAQKEISTIYKLIKGIRVDKSLSLEERGKQIKLLERDIQNVVKDFNENSNRNIMLKEGIIK